MIRFTYLVASHFDDEPPNYEFFPEFEPAKRHAYALTDQISADSSDDVDFIRFNTESPGLHLSRFKSVTETWERM